MACQLDTFCLTSLVAKRTITATQVDNPSISPQAVKQAPEPMLRLLARPEDFLSISTEASSRSQLWQVACYIRYLLYAFIFAFSLSGIFGSWLSKLPATPKDWATGLQGLSVWHTNWGPAVLVIAVAALTLVETYQRFNDPWKWKAIQSCLDGFSEVVYADSLYQDGFEHEHRITIFRLQRGCIKLLKPCTRKWFVPIARSGSLKKETRSIFRFSDNPEQIEGIVGRAWCKPRKWYQASDIPILTQSMAEHQKEDYVNKTNYPVDKALAKRYNARSYAAITMELRGRLWGVLVLDSTCERIPNMESAKTYAKYFRLFICSVTPLLEAL
jgi:hypothetical protein